MEGARRARLQPAMGWTRPLRGGSTSRGARRALSRRRAEPRPAEPARPGAAKPTARARSVLTEHRDRRVNLLRGISVELAEVPPFIRNGDVGQGHSELAVGEVHQLEPAVLQRCGASTPSVTAPRAAASPPAAQPGPRAAESAAAPRPATPGARPHPPAPFLPWSPDPRTISVLRSLQRTNVRRRPGTEPNRWFYYQTASGRVGRMFIVKRRFYTDPVLTISGQWTRDSVKENRTGKSGVSNVFPDR